VHDPIACTDSLNDIRIEKIEKGEDREERREKIEETGRWITAERNAFYRGRFSG
jgi:hypothetical protein